MLNLLSESVVNVVEVEEILEVVVQAAFFVHLPSFLSITYHLAEVQVSAITSNLVQSIVFISITQEQYLRFVHVP